MHRIRVVDQAASQITPEYLTVWNSWFAGQFDEHPALQSPLGADDIQMWLWRSTKASRAAWPRGDRRHRTLKPQTIIAGHRDPQAPDDDVVRVLDQSRRYVEDFDAAVAQSSNTTELIDRMMHKYSTHGNPYTLLLLQRRSSRSQTVWGFRRRA
jgi:hypothetical protein